MYNYAVITDASEKIGLGHAMRQISLAQHAKIKNYTPIFFSRSDLVSYYCKLNGLEHVFYNKNSELIKSFKRHAIKNVVIDVFEKDFAKFGEISRDGLNIILMISEIGFPFKFYGNYAIKVGSDTHTFNKEAKFETNDSQSATVFSGRAWIIFSKEFQNPTNYYPKVRDKIVVAHGGTDPYLLTEKTLAGLSFIRRNLDVDVLITSRYRNIAQIKAICNNIHHNINLILDSPNIVPILSRSSISIINGGNLRYESCLTLTPFIAISFQPQQYICTQQISKLGAGLNLGVKEEVADLEIAEAVRRLLNNDELSSSMKRIMSGLFDLNGTERILNLFYN